MDMEILQDYLPEARELLEKAQEDVLILEREPDNAPVIASVFRAFHTLKGGAGFVDAVELVHWTHDLEDLLDKARSRRITVTPVMVDAILKSMDIIERMLNELAQGVPPTPGPRDLGIIIRKMADAEAPGEPVAQIAIQPAFTKDVFVDSPAPEGVFHVQRTEDGLLLTQEKRLCEEGHAASSDEITPEEFERVLDSLYGGKAPGRHVPAGKDATGDSLPSLRVEPDAATAPCTPAAATPVAAATGGQPAQDGTLRVDAARLDAVVNQVGELVLLRNRLASAVGGLSEENENMARIAREMDLTVNDIQNTVMRLRMQPCKRLFQQLPRVVRDVSRQLGKEVKLEIVGEDVEIDKAVVDALAGPMTHLVRNSLDHGIEGPEERSAAGKTRTANLRVAAIHLGDKVRIEVSDDGKGIDRQFVTQKAVDKGVITAEQAVRLSEQEALELIFRPGFSTKDQATDLSGRGVGMDVVKETARKLRGRLDLQTRLGHGTSIAMEFPLTLAVLPVLYLRLRRDIYALPVSAIDSLTEMETHRIHRLANRVTYRVDDTLIVPLVDLGAILQDKPMRMGSESVEGILTERGLFIVSEVLGNEDSVVKPIDFLADQNWYQGATISGKGGVVLILDAGALSAAALLAAEGSVK